MLRVLMKKADIQEMMSNMSREINFSKKESKGKALH